jgi:ribosomal protein L37AE/L43A
MADEKVCTSCQSPNIKFHGYKGLNLIYKCEDCGLLFHERNENMVM